MVIDLYEKLACRRAVESARAVHVAVGVGPGYLQIGGEPNSRGTFDRMSGDRKVAVVASTASQP